MSWLHTVVGFMLAAAALSGACPAAAQVIIKVPPSCQEHVPAGATRPALEEKFPDRGISGYASNLELKVVHGKGETVLPDGFRVASGSDAAKALAFWGFAVPEPDGGTGPSIVVEHGETSSTTRLSIPFVLLPGSSGKVTMTLPPVPIAVARASGEILTVCTAPHAIVVDEPIANLQNPKVAPNPDPRAQREEWLMAKIVVAAVVALALLTVLAVWLVKRHRAKPKPAPVVPRKLPWVAALEELAELKNGPLLAQRRFDEYFDRASDCVRKYLGARYGFDGLEKTSDEMRGLLRRVRPPVPELPRITAFLADCDLVKFARQVPTEAECRDAVERGEAIVRMTTPPAHGGPQPPAVSTELGAPAPVQPTAVTGGTAASPPPPPPPPPQEPPG